MTNWFSKKTNLSLNESEARFQTVVWLVKGLDRKELNCLIEGAQLIWQGHNKISKAKTATEKEYEDINEPEAILKELENGGLGKE